MELIMNKPNHKKLSAIFMIKDTDKYNFMLAELA